MLFVNYNECPAARPANRPIKPLGKPPGYIERLVIYARADVLLYKPNRKA